MLLFSTLILCVHATLKNLDQQTSFYERMYIFITSIVKVDYQGHGVKVKVILVWYRWAGQVPVTEM